MTLLRGPGQVPRGSSPRNHKQKSAFSFMAKSRVHALAKALKTGDDAGDSKEDTADKQATAASASVGGMSNMEMASRTPLEEETSSSTRSAALSEKWL